MGWLIFIVIVVIIIVSVRSEKKSKKAREERARSAARQTYVNTIEGKTCDTCANRNNDNCAWYEPQFRHNRPLSCTNYTNYTNY